MTQNLPPPMTSLLPETAPFTPEQRAWLNGFFSGYLGLEQWRDTAVAAGRRRADGGLAGRR